MDCLSEQDRLATNRKLRAKNRQTKCKSPPNALPRAFSFFGDVKNRFLPPQRARFLPLI